MPNDTVALRLENVTDTRDGGMYTCRCGNVTQTYEIAVKIRPFFRQTFNSTKTSITVNIVLNCSAGGYPPPKITWFRNGLSLFDNYKMDYESPVLKIHALDIDDQG